MLSNQAPSPTYMYTYLKAGRPGKKIELPLKKAKVDFDYKHVDFDKVPLKDLDFTNVVMAKDKNYFIQTFTFAKPAPPTPLFDDLTAGWISRKELAKKLFEKETIVTKSDWDLRDLCDKVARDPYMNSAWAKQLFEYGDCVYENGPNFKKFVDLIESNSYMWVFPEWLEKNIHCNSFYFTFEKRTPNLEECTYTDLFICKLNGTTGLFTFEPVDIEEVRI